MDKINYIVILYSYLLGAIPSAYLLVKIFFKSDIRQQGTGNVGAMNTYDVTGKRRLGLIVFVIDFLKGSAAVLITEKLLGLDLYSVSIATSFVILGHNYNVFLKFKGGRGLASAAGAFTFINPLLIILWLLMYFSSYYVIKKDVHVGTAVGAIASPLMIWGVPEYGIKATQTMTFENVTQFKILATFICFLIFLKNVKPLTEKLDKAQN